MSEDMWELEAWTETNNTSPLPPANGEWADVRTTFVAAARRHSFATNPRGPLRHIREVDLDGCEWTTEVVQDAQTIAHGSAASGLDTSSLQAPLTFNSRSIQ